MDQNKRLVVTIAHDILCPWCWVGFFQAKKLREEFPQIRQVWRGFELLPEELGPLPDFKPQPPDPNAPTRFECSRGRRALPCRKAELSGSSAPITPWKARLTPRTRRRSGLTPTTRRSTGRSGSIRKTSATWTFWAAWPKARGWTKPSSVRRLVQSVSRSDHAL